MQVDHARSNVPERHFLHGDAVKAQAPRRRTTRRRRGVDADDDGKQASAVRTKRGAVRLSTVHASVPVAISHFCLFVALRNFALRRRCANRGVLAPFRDLGESAALSDDRSDEAPRLTPAGDG